VQRDAALGVALADRDPQPRVAVGIAVEAVEAQAADLITPGPAPPGHDQRGPLIRVLELLDGAHQGGELVVRDEPGQRLWRLGDVAAEEQHTPRDVVPAPGGGLVDEPGQQGDDGAAGRQRQRGTGMGAVLGAEPAQEPLRMGTVQLVQADHVGVLDGQPAHQPVQGVPEVPDRLWPVQVRPQVQPQEALDHRRDPRRRAGRGHMVGPGPGIDPAGGGPVDLTGVEQQDLRGMEPAARGREEPPGDPLRLAGPPAAA